MKQEPADFGSANLENSIRAAESAKEALENSGQAVSAAKLAEAIAAAKEARFSIGVVAIAKRGKSTLINGLLGRSDDLLAPVDMFPATNVVSCFANHPETKARVIFNGDGYASQADDIALEEIKQYACEKFNPGNRKGVKIIEVMGPFPRLGERVVLVDTPGADNASNSVHDQVLLDFLPRLDAVIFLVTADEPLTDSELALLKEVRRNDVRKLIFAINKADKVDAKELSEALAHNRKALSSIGYADAPIFPISARNYQTEGTDTGSRRLVGAIDNLIGEGRARIMADRLDDMVRRYLAEAKDIIGERIQLSELTADQIREETKALNVSRQEYILNRSKWERQFVSSWQASFADFENSLDKLESQMISEYTNLVDKTAAPKLGPLAQIVHTDIIKRLDELLEPHISTLNGSLSAASDRVASDCVRSMKIAPRQAEAITVSGKHLRGIADIVTAGAPSAIIAAIAAAAPGGMASLIIGMAPAVTATTWNPFTWVSAAATGAANAAVTTAGSAVAAILAPIAAFVTPLAVAFGAYRVFATWRSRIFATRNKLSLGVKDLIREAIAETRKNTRNAQSQVGQIFENFTHQIEARIEDYTRDLQRLADSRPDPAEIFELKENLAIIDSLSGHGTEPTPESTRVVSPTLFQV